jgi:hypothetical protein
LERKKEFLVRNDVPVKVILRDCLGEGKAKCGDYLSEGREKLAG